MYEYFNGYVIREGTEGVPAGKDISQNGTCAYYGYIQARKEGHRK